MRTRLDGAGRIVVDAVTGGDIESRVCNIAVRFAKVRAGGGVTAASDNAVVGYKDEHAPNAMLVYFVSLGASWTQVH